MTTVRPFTADQARQASDLRDDLTHTTLREKAVDILLGRIKRISEDKTKVNVRELSHPFDGFGHLTDADKAWVITELEDLGYKYTPWIEGCGFEPLDYGIPDKFSW